jgi:hypothetical protein
MKIIPHDNACEINYLTKGNAYTVIDFDDDGEIDECFAIINDEGDKVWIDDWDCKEI